MIRRVISIEPVAIDMWFGNVRVANVGCIPCVVLTPSFRMRVNVGSENVFKYS